MPTKAAQSRRKNCCMSCRRRHRKCVNQPGASHCGACIESGQNCQFESGIRFKYNHPQNRQDGREELEVPGTSTLPFFSVIYLAHNFPLVSFTTPRGINGDIFPTQDATMEHSNPDISATMIPPTANGPEALTTGSRSGHDLTATETAHLASSMPQPMSTQDVQPLTEREAFLFMTYVHRLAPLVSSHCLFLCLTDA